MDVFEETMEKMSTMSEDETAQMMERLMESCNCPGCPSYNACAQDLGQKLFCAKGRSGCIAIQKGCDCGTCPVKEELELRNRSYCVRGSESELRHG